MSEGIIVSTPRHGVGDSKNIAFTSEAAYLGLDVRHTPKFFDFTTYTFAVPPGIPGVGNTTTVNMLTINHNLLYVPVILVYIYSYNFTGNYTVPGTYQMGGVTITGAGFVQQTITHQVDPNTFQVNYTITNGSANPSAPVPFDLTGAKFGIKYFIFDNDMQHVDS